MIIKTYTYKSKALAIILGLFLGGLGMHRFYLGNIGAGFAYLLGTLFMFATPLFWLVPCIALVDVLQLCFRGSEYFQRQSGFTVTEGQ